MVGEEKRFFHLLDVEGRAGVGRATLTFGDLLGGSQGSAHTSVLTAEMGHGTQ